MCDIVREDLLNRINTAIASRPVPPLVNTYADESDWSDTIRDFGLLWKDGPAEAITADLDIGYAHLYWLTYEQFRFGFLRLVESALRHPETDVEFFAVLVAAEPVPRDAVAQPLRFCEFSPNEIRLIADLMDEFHRAFKSRPKPERALYSELAVRVNERAVRNWRRFAVNAGE